MVKTDHVLFIAAGAFHVAKVSDLIPELQGRFPIRVELEPLTRDDLVRILKEPKNSLVQQYIALLATEGVDVQFRDDAIEELARIAAEVNERMENIGARRLHTVMERLLDEVSFDAPDLRGQRIVVDARVRARAARGRRAGRGPLAVHPVDGRRVALEPRRAYKRGMARRTVRRSARRRSSRPNYRQAPVALVRGEGARVWDADGNEYLDCLAGIATVALGHCHPALVRALEEQARTLWHVSNLFYIPRPVELAEALARRRRRSRAARLPLQQRRGGERGDAEARPEVPRRPGPPRAPRDRRLPTTRSTAARCSRSPRPASRSTTTASSRSSPACRHVPYGDVAALEAAIGPRTAAFIVEPIQGESGVMPRAAGLPREGARADPRGGRAASCFDEIQTGMGRTGRMWAHEWEGVVARCSCPRRRRSATASRWARCSRREEVGLPPHARAATAPPSAGTRSACAVALAALREIARVLARVASVVGAAASRRSTRSARAAASCEVRGRGHARSASASRGVDAGEVVQARARARAPRERHRRRRHPARAAPHPHRTPRPTWPSSGSPPRSPACAAEALKQETPPWPDDATKRDFLRLTDSRPRGAPRAARARRGVEAPRQEAARGRSSGTTIGARLREGLDPHARLVPGRAWQLGGHAMFLVAARHAARARRADPGHRARPRRATSTRSSSARSSTRSSRRSRATRRAGGERAHRRVAPVPAARGPPHHRGAVRRGRARQRRDSRVAWIGDGNNMANSWIEAALVLGFDLRDRLPRGLRSRPGARRRAPANARARRPLARARRSRARTW